MKINRGPGRVSALEAKSLAQWIAFAPFVFQASVVMRDRGLLAGIDAAGEAGIAVQQLADQTGLSLYGTRVLLDFGVDIGLVEEADGAYAVVVPLEDLERPAAGQVPDAHGLVPG